MKVYVCEVYDHKTESAVIRGMDLEECCGNACDRCMEWFKANNIPDDDMRYEFYCTEEELDFVWEMTENDFYRLMNPSDYEDNYCGALYFGDCKGEFVYESVSHDEYVEFTNLYVLHEDGGYATLEDGTHYDMWDDLITLPEAEAFNGFEEFKTECERLTLKMLTSTTDASLVQHAIGKANVEVWHQPIKI